MNSSKVDFDIFSTRYQTKKKTLQTKPSNLNFSSLQFSRANAFLKVKSNAIDFACFWKWLIKISGKKTSCNNKNQTRWVPGEYLWEYFILWNIRSASSPVISSFIHYRFTEFRTHERFLLFIADEFQNVHALKNRR